MERPYYTLNVSVVKSVILLTGKLKYLLFWYGNIVRLFQLYQKRKRIE